jgi:hypothetical protein
MIFSSNQFKKYNGIGLCVVIIKYPSSPVGFEIIVIINYVEVETNDCKTLDKLDGNQGFERLGLYFMNIKYQLRITLLGDRR